MHPTLFAHAAAAAPIPVEVRQTDQGWQLWRGGAPYFIRGAGGSGPLDQLAAAGANSLRTWGVSDDLEDRLDEAHRLGLSVTVGLWLGHARHGFDYGDAAQVAAQKERVRQDVLRFKDHPAVLMWGIGNEMEGFEAGDDDAVWRAVNDIAAMIQEIDPLHPTMTVTAYIHGERLAKIASLCPDVDVHGINAYGGAFSLAADYRARGGAKPYVLTEFAHPGTWEVGATTWGAPLEPTSTEKAALYRKSYEGGVLAAPGLALGSYAFTWGAKVEATTTWFGMFLDDGARLAAIDVMSELWTGRPPAQRAPVLAPLALEGPAEVAPGARVRVRSEVTDPEGAPLRAEWTLMPEVEPSVGGDHRDAPEPMPGAILRGDAAGAEVQLPDEPGAYRLYLAVYDDAGSAATANVPLRVIGEVRPRLPIAVYEDGFDGRPWTPSGWMGKVESMSLDGAHAQGCHSGAACVRFGYSSSDGWAGVAWQSPPNDWGDAAGGRDVRGATALELWARGEVGGERLEVGVGLLGPDVAHPDSAISPRQTLRLRPGWRRYTIDLAGLDLSAVKTGFVFTVVGRGPPTVVYLDDIRFVE